MSNRHVSFERSFVPTNVDSLQDQDYLPFWDMYYGESFFWKDLYEFRCVVVLAEGKSGKTYEFKEQHRKLTADGVFSFFVPLELLFDGNFDSTISDDDLTEFERWQSSSLEDAVFFLDAVDELKLRKGSLRLAIRKIKEAIGSHICRAKFFISCRPKDWDQEIDITYLSSLVCQAGKQLNKPVILDGEALFTAVISHDESVNIDSNDETDDKPVKVFSLLPLTRKETKEFASRFKPELTERFEFFLNQNELWHLYQLPVDIISALDQLESEGQLGDLEQQLRFGIGQRLRETSLNKPNTLSEERSLKGVECIALALLLMKRRSIYFNSSEVDKTGLNVADVLTDWAASEMAELLGKPLFDPTGVHAFRFHHRSTQEYLASKRLQKLRESGLSNSELYLLLFAEIDYEEVIIPSMEPIVAWLSLWNPDIMAMAKLRNPLLLFRQGIPSMLNIETRADLLRKFVDKYSSSQWRRIGIGHDELKRVASCELGNVVRELWTKAYSGYETRELLLELIYQTPLIDCVDFAYAAAFDCLIDYHHRTYAAWAVLSCGTEGQKQDIGDAVFSKKWPDYLVRNVIPELLPDAIQTDRFIELSRTLNEDPDLVHGLGYALLKAVRSNTVTIDQKIRIRDEFTNSIWDTRISDSPIYRATSAYDHFIHATIAACFATIPAKSDERPDWAWSLAVAFHFGEKTTSIIAKDETEFLKTAIKSDVQLREAFFWACLRIIDAFETTKNDFQRSRMAVHSDLLSPFTHDDYPWLLSALSPGKVETYRGVAFYLLADFFKNDPVLVARIAELIIDRADLSEELHKILNPPIEVLFDHDIEHRKWMSEHKEKESIRLQSWINWRNSVLVAEDYLLGETNCHNTLPNIFQTLQMSKPKNGNWSYWNASFVRTTFNDAFLLHLREVFASYWRQVDVQLYSERLKDKRNSYPQSSLIALVAVKCSSESPNWVNSLSKEEAILAVRIALIEINGFASYLPQIEAVYPETVEEVIIGELKAQFELFHETQALPILNDIQSHGSLRIQRVSAAFFITNLTVICETMNTDNRSSLIYALKLVANHITQNDMETVVGTIIHILNAAENSTVRERNFWLNILAFFNVEKACQLLIEYSNYFTSVNKHEDAVSLFASLFGERHMDFQLDFEALDINDRLVLLKGLVIKCYQLVNPCHDLSPDKTPRFVSREAEHACNYLLQCLSNTKSRATLPVLAELSSLPEFKSISDRLKQMVTELAGQIAEPAPMTILQFRAFDDDKTYRPIDNPSLFNVMNNRIDDFEHHLLNDEHSIIDTLRKVGSETELRRNISNWLNLNSRSAYTITQEAVVQGEKRTDIRLQPIGMRSYATIELKLDDTECRWSANDLRAALVEQLVGRYLNHERCQAGCLLICMRTRRNWQHPDSGKKMNLKQTIAWLQGLADQIVHNRPNLLISVKGIDYSEGVND